MQQKESQQVTDLDISAHTGGISVKYKIDGMSFYDEINHDQFRSWSYGHGYWDEEYFKFLHNLKPVVIERYIKEQMTQNVSA